MAFLEDPRLRQRWNQISQNAEAATENAAAGIWSFQHNYINPCLASLGESVDNCASICIGDREERARKRRERDMIRGGAEYSFDFYDDWYQEEEPGLLGGWSYDDWDRLLVGSGSSRRGGGEVTDQPRRKRGMSYGTRGARRKPAAQDDPTVIPSTQPIGFLGKLPWKIGGTLRYKPSAADLQEHPGHHEQLGENAPLLGDDGDDNYFGVHSAPPRGRSGTTGSGGTSDSYRSRGDLFPSDGEEDAVPLDDEFTLPPERADDRSSHKTRSGKGKRPAGSRPISRTVSRTTVASGHTGYSGRSRKSADSINGSLPTPSMEDLHLEEERVAREEDGEVERKRAAAAQLAQKKGLKKEINPDEDTKREPLPVHEVDDSAEDPPPVGGGDFSEEAKLSATLPGTDEEPLGDTRHEAPLKGATLPTDEEFVPARLPMFR
ncbi:uncharacterized protein DNG_00759 [Cephalotrichum gorgonifer]|uniref:Uncharacterized protein n=1 Tax=Cephalotrichum gorgonifer TaxID=2041049 RepID=A0AAE8MRB4_9PEZI|nr:uncharacterized protein DNG_00759 [Cephalotrichum gorgonifer]